MHESITIKKATVEHIQLIRQIGQLTFYETFHALNSEENMQAYLSTAFTDEKLQGELQHIASQFYLAWQQEEVVGYLKLNVDDAQTEPMGDEALEIERIYVAASHQKYGIGKRFMQLAEQQAREQHKSKIWLGVWEKNEKAIHFYERQGFKKVSEHIFQMGDEAQTDYVMEKVIAHKC